MRENPRCFSLRQTKPDFLADQKGYPASQAGRSPAGGSLMTVALLMAGWAPHFVERRWRRGLVEVQHADRFAPLGFAADGHLGDVDLVRAENRAHRADDARHVAGG